MAYHKNFKRFKPAAVDAVRQLITGWQELSDAAKLERMQDAAARLSAAYGILTPGVVFDAADWSENGRYYVTIHEIVLTKLSQVTFLHEFRHAMQHHVAGIVVQRDAEHDARGWSQSLYHVVAPRTYAKLRAEGAIFYR